MAIAHDPKVARAFLEVAQEMGATRQQTLALLSAGLVESNLATIDYGDRDSLGPLQQRPSQGWGTPAQVQDPRYAARKFLEAAMKIDQFANVGDLAAQVQRPAAEYRGRYQERLPDARRLFRKYNGTGGGGGGQGRPTPGGSMSPDALSDAMDAGLVLENVFKSVSDKIKDRGGKKNDDDRETDGADVESTFGEFGVTPDASVGERQAQLQARQEAEQAGGKPGRATADDIPDGNSSDRSDLSWGGHSNGQIPIDQLVAVNGVHYAGKAKHYFEKEAAKAFRAMVRAARKDGVDITLTDSYRDYATQERLAREKPDLAATPGRSIHGWGKAIDVADGRDWIQRNGHKFGWVWPDWARPGGSMPESWHFEFRPGSA